MVIRVLVISHMYPRNIDSAVGIFVHNQVKHLMKVGCQVRVISPVPYSPKILWVNPKWKKYGQILKYNVIGGIPVYYPRYARLPGKWFFNISCYTMYYAINRIYDLIIKEFKPHILHTYTAIPDGYAGLMLKRKYNIPFVCSFRGSDINVYPQFDRHTFCLTKRVISETDQITTVSKALKIIAETIAKPKKEIQVIYNGCSSEAFASNKKNRWQIRRELGILSEEKVIIFVGDILRNKGIFELVNAFNQINTKYSNLHLIFVGDGSEFNGLAKIISSYGLNNKIHLVGAKPPNEIPNWLSAADIFVLPTYYEGLPSAILEAMASGLPVVATRVGGIPEVVEDGKSGILVDKKDVSSLVKCIVELIENKDKCEKMGKYGLKIIEKNFTWNDSVIKLKEIYEELLNHKPFI